MTTFIRVSAAILAAVLIFTARGSLAQGYEPAQGDEVVIYFHTYTAKTFDEAKRIFVEEFGPAISASGQDRHSYMFANPETHQFIGLSFFGKGHSVDTWHGHDARQAVLDKLEPLFGAPLAHQRYVVIWKHNTGD